MRITQRQLTQIIREELIREAGFGDVRVDDLRREQRDALLSDAREQFDEWKTNVEVRVRRVPNPAYKVWLDSDVLTHGPRPKMFIEKNFSAPYLTMNQLIGALTTLDSSFTAGKFINIPEPERSQLVGEISEIPNEIDLTKSLSANIDGYWHTKLRALPSTELKVSGQNLNEALTECLEPAFKMGEGRPLRCDSAESFAPGVADVDGPGRRAAPDHCACDPTEQVVAPYVSCDVRFAEHNELCCFQCLRGVHPARSNYALAVARA
jgi:hypothetical protein